MKFKLKCKFADGTVQTYMADTKWECMSKAIKHQEYLASVTGKPVNCYSVKFIK